MRHLILFPNLKEVGNLRVKSKIFKPLLAPNDQPNLYELKYPLLASYKLDGVRCIFYKGKILSRSLKEIPNKQLKEKFEPIRKYTEDTQTILDGEIYSPNLLFQDIISFVMTEDFEDKKTVKKFGRVLPIPEDLKFYIFDSVVDDDINVRFQIRQEKARKSKDWFPDLIEPVEHKFVNDKEDVEKYFEEALRDGYEGLILRDPKAGYKFGRATLKEKIIYKVKPYVTFDAKITGVVQSTEVDPNAEKKINELGRSVTSKKKNDRIAIEKASAFYVDYQGKELKVCLAMTDEEKQEVWKNRDSYIGNWIEFKGMIVGMKDLPRHPIMTRFREDKNGS